MKLLSIAQTPLKKWLMPTVLNRFGLAAQRAKKFCIEGIDNAKGAMRVKLRLIRLI